MAQTINYTVIGIQRSVGMPVIGVDGQSVTAPAQYQVTLQAEQNAQFTGFSQVTLITDHAGMSKYAVDAAGTIVINDPA